ncbi:VOC family protein [Herbaspirillum autotrophicum]|uniref:VOC family protein n=1 Tax=Herbaspirillum autotrophicum TaxID=180195 RepID=UPI00067B433B|nr:VOC family protein [Herbaspirillum autotrophicum]
MAITGISSHEYRVADLERSTAFFTEFGLPLTTSTDSRTTFSLPDGTSVLLIKDPENASDGKKVAANRSVRTVFGVDTKESLDRLVADLSRDRQMSIDAHGTASFNSDCGIQLGLQLFVRKLPVCAPDAINAPGAVQRMNTWRKWRMSARPRTMNHAVYGVENYKESWDFFRHRLGFRLSDHSRGLGVFLRADGAPEHHTLFLADCHFMGRTHGPGLQHVCFGVEDIDEIMAGAMNMERAGHKSHLGLGRHRIASALFYYLDCPAGGEAEYGGDTDYLDDGWIPREWSPGFGFITWASHFQQFLQKTPEPEVRFLTSEDDVYLDPIGR